MTRILALSLFLLACQPVEPPAINCVGYPLTTCLNTNQVCVANQCADLCEQDEDCESGWCRGVSGQIYRACAVED
jgi:hypothetical protein